MSDPKITLYGRIILEGDVRALSGLHIGGSPGPLAIGGLDLPVIRNAVDGMPYIPGSSLKGKMRSLWEKNTGALQNYPVNSTPGKEVRVHVCQKRTDYEKCPVCQIYGTLGQSEAAFPTRILVRDIPLDGSSLAGARTDLPYTEVKWEAAIDRITSAATPRQIERVPAGALFAGMQIVFSVYNAADRKRFLDVLTALQLVEDDYLGGHGSRGSGRVKFQNLTVLCKASATYSAVPASRTLGELTAPADLLAWIEACIPIGADGGD